MSAGHDWYRMWTVELLSAAPRHLAAVADLVEEYVRLPDAWADHGGPPDHLPLSFREEITGLPGRAVPPTGDMAVGVDHAGAAFAAGMLVPFDDERAEIKRLYVRPTHQCEGVGRVLVQTLLGIARDLGYRTVVLDVMSARPAAVRLYERSGFVAVEAFRTYPAHHRMRFYRRSL